MEGAITIVLP